MKKLLIISICAMSLLSANVGFAETDLGERARQSRLQLQQRQDELLQFLLQIPFEQRQYIFPLLSEKKSVSKKIKTHPDVIVWKGKRPTRIAKRFQNDPELLEFLPAQFYIYLSPDMWPDDSNADREQNPNQLLVNLIQNNNMNEVAADELVQLKNGLNMARQKLTPEQQNLLNQKGGVFMKEMMLFPSNSLADELKTQGYTSTQDFAKKVDKIAQAYRTYKQGKIPTNSPEQEFVQNYFSLIPYIFKESGFGNLLNVNAYTD